MRVSLFKTQISRSESVTFSDNAEKNMKSIKKKFRKIKEVVSVIDTYRHRILQKER